MRLTRRWGDRIATLMSWLAGALVLVAAAAANAQSPAAPAPPAQAESGFAARHRLGLQIGGSAVFQVAYRYRMMGPLHVDLGLAGLPHSPVNGSLGVVAGAPADNRWFLYVGVGVGHAGIERSGMIDGRGCYGMPGCPNGGDYLSFLYGRAGVAVALGATRRHLVGLDVGGWYGSHRKREEDAAGVETSWSRRIVWPMAGLSYFLAL
jgi:hypothetical protein